MQKRQPISRSLSPEKKRQRPSSELLDAGPATKPLHIPGKGFWINNI